MNRTYWDAALPLAFLICLAVPTAASEPPRTWTRASGQRFEAGMLYIQGADAYLTTSDGRILSVPLEQFAQVDWPYLRVAPQRGSRMAADRARIEAALRSELEFDFIQTPLSDAVDFLYEDFTIYVEAGIGDMPVTFRGVCPLEEMLNGLAPDKCFIHHHGIAKVVSNSSLNNYIDTRPYRIRSVIDPDDLIRQVTVAIDATSWKTAGGFGRIAVASPGLVFVSHSDFHHRQIERAFPQLLHPIPLVDPPPITDLERALTETVKWEFIQTPFSQLVDFVSKHFGVPIRLHKGVYKNLIITRDIKAPYYSLLHELLSGLENLTGGVEPSTLTWTLDDDGVVIVDENDEQEILSTRSYLMEGIAPPHQYQAWIEALSSTVDPSGWNSADGKASIVASEDGPYLVVQQTYQVHQKLQRIFTSLHAAARKQRGS